MQAFADSFIAPSKSSEGVSFQQLIERRKRSLFVECAMANRIPSALVLEKHVFICLKRFQTCGKTPSKKKKTV